MEGEIINQNSLSNTFSSEKFSEFADSVFHNMDRNESTRSQYQKKIPLFIQFVQDQGGLNINSYLKFKASLKERTDFALTTKNAYLAPAKKVLQEMARLRLIPTDITLGIKGFAVGKKHKRDGLSEEEILSIVDKLQTLADNAKNLRLKALFCLLALQGLRQIEIVRLDKEDIDLVNSRAYVQGKGKDDKELIHLHPETVKALKRYIKASKVGSGALFVCFSNKAKGQRLTTRSIKREMKYLFDALDIEKTVHGFRHYFVTKLLKTMSVHDVRKFSRHQNLEMLVVYEDSMDLKEKAADVFKVFNNIKMA